MRVKVVLSGNLDLNQYEADAIVYQQVVENIGGQLMQVPGIVVRLDSGELKVQPLQMDLYSVQVFEVKDQASKQYTEAEKNRAATAQQELVALYGLPLYQCHKVVGAFKINAIDHKPNPDPTGKSGSNSYGAIITPLHMTAHAFEVSAEYISKHNPQVGGYYVKYADGYESYSPAEAFEDGYSFIENQL